MTTLHPVDSTYHRCCNAIGQHSRQCPDGPAAVFAEAAADHDVTVLNNTTHTWCCACSCGWRSLDFIAEHPAREAAATHYLLAGGAADDDSHELLAAMRRHPAGTAGITARDDRGVTTTMPQPALPAGAVDTSEFDENSRVVFGPSHDAGPVSVRASAIQHQTGMITTDEGRPAVQLGGGNLGLTPQETRKLALGLLDAAELADQ